MKDELGIKRADSPCYLTGKGVRNLQLCGSKDGFCLLGLNRGKEMRKMILIPPQQGRAS
jgi:hypothetical protein